MGVKAGVASDEVFAALTQKNNDFIRERIDLIDQLAKKDQQGQAGGQVIDPKAAEQARQIGVALDVIKQRADELFKSGIAPGTEEFRKMLETVRQAEAAARATFGLAIPEGLQKSFTATNTFITELSRAGNVDLTKIAEGLPDILRSASEAAKGFGQVINPATGAVIASFDEASRAVGLFSNTAITAAGEVLKVADESGKLPASLQEWNREISGAADMFRVIQTDSGQLLTNLAGSTSEAASLAPAFTSAIGPVNGMNAGLAQTLALMREIARARQTAGM